MQPQLVLRVEDSKTNQTVLDYPPRARGRVVSAATAKQVATLLRAVCSKTGTAPAADIPGYEVAGKTGTTQKLVNGRYSSAHHVASFSGFFPVHDPRLAITVIIDEPKGDGIAYGGKFAAPIFTTVAKNCIQWLDIKPTTSLSRSVAGVER
jgi:cell division protein FtsI/penicillin-binding protein 2